jgi:hypothetical protein
MFVCLKDIGRLGIAGSLSLLACSSNTPATNTGNAGTSAGGMASAGSSSSGSGTGMASAGSSTGGMATGGAGASAGGSAGTSAGTGGAGGSGGAGSKSKTTFFVTSDTSKTGKLGSLEMADKRCQDLATKAGIGDHTFHAYLSTATVNAKDRIGTGPWVNSEGTKLADSVADLHSGRVKGDPTLFIDENKMKIHGQWDGGPVEHDILTGSKADGTLQPNETCMDWTSDAAQDTAQVGHTDGMGPGKATTGTYSSWNSSHASGSCADTSKAGGAGRLYCFAID